MNRINTSRQTLSGKQRNCNYIPSGAIAQHVLDSTVERESAQTIIEEDGRFLVASSKFVGRYYIVAESEGRWTCSAKDSAVAARCIAQVRAYSLIAA